MINSRRYMLAAGAALMTIAVLLFGWLAWENYGTDYLAKGKHSAEISKLKGDWKNGKTDLPSGPSQQGKYTGSLPGEGSDIDENSLTQGQPFGLLYIPRFGSSYVQPIIEATSLNQLADGVGHGLGTAMPGQIGNMGIAGHRTTWGHPFRNIDKIRNGDKIQIVTAHDTYDYVVTGHQIVKASDVDVWDAVPHKPHAKPTERLLTLSACHPLYEATERYIIYAKQVGHEAH